MHIGTVGCCAQSRVQTPGPPARKPRLSVGRATCTKDTGDTLDDHSGDLNPASYRGAGVSGALAPQLYWEGVSWAVTSQRWRGVVHNPQISGMSGGTPLSTGTLSTS